MHKPEDNIDPKESENKDPITIHPAAYSALNWVHAFIATYPVKTMMFIESFASNAIEGNPLAEACGETLRRIMAGEGVGSQYILGLAWTLKTMHEQENKTNNESKRSNNNFKRANSKN